MKMFKSKFLFAEKSILIKTNNKKLNQVLTVYFPEFSSKKKPDLTFEYYFYEDNFDLSLYLLKNEWKSDEKIFFHKKNRNLVVIENRKGKKKKLLSCVLDLKKKHAKTEIRSSRPFFWNLFVFNLAKCLAVCLNEKKGNVIHSAALAIKNQGFLLPGGNDAGKSTILRLCPEIMGLGEDLNFLFKKGKKFFIQSYPLLAMVITLDKKRARPFELKAVLFLHKSKKLELKKLTKAEAIGNLLQHDIQGTFNFQKIRLKERISLYAELFSCVPSFRLHFPLKKNLCKKLEVELRKTVDLKGICLI